MVTSFTVPELRKSPKEWYVYFEFTIDGKLYPRKKREGLNRIKSLKARHIEGEALAQARHEWLKAGWNPVHDPDYKLRKVSSQEQAQQMTLAKALRWALEKKAIAPKTRQGYKSLLDHIEKAIYKLGYAYLPLNEVKRFNIMEVMDLLVKEFKVSNHGYNKHRDALRALFGELLTRDVIEYNPAAKIPDRIVTDSTKYAPLELEEKTAIAKHLLIQHPRFFTYVLVTYHSGIRPKEVLALRIRDINLKTRLITIVPNAEDENSKTKKKIRKSPIDKELYTLLLELELHKYPPDYRVFGSPFGPGGNRGSREKGVFGVMRPEYFSPSPYRIKRDTATKLWRRIIKNGVTGLGVDKHMYALKHTGSDDKILAGVDLDALRSMYGHATKGMTAEYAAELQNVYKREIITKAPAFTAPSPVLDDWES